MTHLRDADFEDSTVPVGACTLSTCTLSNYKTSLRSRGRYTRFMDDTAELSGAPDTRLAIYGTLAPGRVNHHQISALTGKWRRGTVRGKLFSSGWGAALGFPGLILDPLGPAVDVDLFESEDLPKHWARLDEFEGSVYQRVVTTVNTEEGEQTAWIYVLAEHP